jgi:tetratricopeptide (TPR) repeat protein
LKEEPEGRHRVAAVLMAALILGGCATAPKVDTRENSARALLDQAARLIEAASLRDLGHAATILSSPALDGSHKAEALSSLAADIFQKLYPEASSPFPRAVTSAVRDATNESAFFLVLTPCFTLLAPGGALEDTAASDLKARLASADRLNQGSVLPPYLQGILIQRQSGDPKAARARYEESLRRGPDFYPAGVKIAQIILGGADGDRDDAGRGDSDVRASSAFIPAAELPLLERLADLLPTPTLRFAALARADLAAGQPQAAADAAARGLLLAPEDPGFFFLRAEAFEALGNWYQSLSIVDTLLKLRPDQPRAALMKARLLYEKQQNGEQAIAVLYDAEKRFPSDASFPELRGKILVETGRSDEGVAALTEALTLEPGRVSTLTLLLRQAVQTKSWTRASQLLAQIPEKEMSADILRTGWLVATNLGDFPQAVLSAQALERLQAGARPMALEARSLVAAGALGKAMEVVMRALAAADTPALRAELLTIRATAGSDDPMRDLRYALLVDPENQEALSAISDLFAQQQDWRKAAAYARQASELSPQDASLARKAAELQKRAESSGR